MSPKDIEYYRGRALMEAALAKIATCDVAAAVHSELALRYQALVDQAEGRDSREVADSMQKILPRTKLGVLWAE